MKTNFFLFLIIFALSACRKDNDQSDNLTSKRWMFKGFKPMPVMSNDTAVYYHPVPVEINYMGISFGKNNIIGLTSSCNSGTGEYCTFIESGIPVRPSSIKIVIRPTLVTKLVCVSVYQPTVQSVWEDRYIKALANAHHYIINKDTLMIYSNGEVAFDTLVIFPGGEMTFIAEFP
jgi:hypothetical protein